MTQFVTTRLDYFRALLPYDGTRCAADLLNMFEQWAKKEEPGYWFKVRQQDLIEYLGGIYGKDAISQATNLLNQLGLVHRKNHSRDGQIHTFYYQFDPSGLAKLLDLHRQLVQSVRNWADITYRIILQQVFPFLKSNSDFPASQIGLPVAQAEEQVAQVGKPEISLCIDPRFSDPQKTDPQTARAVVVEKEAEEAEESLVTAALVLDEEPELVEASESTGKEKLSAAARDGFYNRLRSLDITLTQEVRSLVRDTPPAQLERNIAALEEEATTKGLKTPIGAFKHFVSNNCQPRQDRQAWWSRAAAALGKERRDRLLQAVMEYAGEVWVIFTNGQRVLLAEAQKMSWEALAKLAEGFA